MVLDIEEYAKSKGIPIESIPSDVFESTQKKSIKLRAVDNPKAELFKKMCLFTEGLLKTCVGSPDNNSSSSQQIPPKCMEKAAEHLECLITKRETAYQMAVKLAGKEVTEKVFPYYEDNKKKALDLMEIYKKDAAADKNKVFWS